MQQSFDEYISEFADIYIEILKELDVPLSFHLNNCEQNRKDVELEDVLKSNEKITHLKTSYPQFAYLTKSVFENEKMFDYTERDSVLFPVFDENEQKKEAICSLLVWMSSVTDKDETDLIFDYLDKSDLKEDCWSKCFAQAYSRFPEQRLKFVIHFFDFLNRTDILTIPIGKNVISVFDGTKESMSELMLLLQKIYEKATPTYSFSLEKKEIDKLKIFRHCSLSDIPQEYPFVQMLYKTRYLNSAEFEAAYIAMGMEKMSKYDFRLAQRILPRLLMKASPEKISYEQAVNLARSSKQYVEDEYWLSSSALVLAEVFGVKFDAYLKKVLPYLSFYDATSFIKDIDYGNPNNKELGVFLMNNVVYQDENNQQKLHSLSELESICRAWKNMPLKEIKSRKYKKILSLCNAYCYKNIHSIPFSREAMYWKLSEAEYITAEKIYLDSQSVPDAFDIQKKWKCGEYVGRFLPRSDVRVGFFGHYTGCCQHFTGVGKSAAISSIKDDFSQLFVVEKNGRIVAGSFVWIAEEKGQKGVCFDSVEILKSYDNRLEISSIYQRVCESLSKIYSKVTLGKNPFPCLGFVRPLPIPQGVYSDAENQFVFQNMQIQRD